MESNEERVKRHRDDRIRMGHSYPHQDEVHPKDRDLPGFTRDSQGRPKPGYHSPSGVSGMDTDSDIWMKTAQQPGLADAVGAMMYGSEGWEERRKRAEHQRKTKSVLTWLVTTGCGVLFVLILVAALLGMIVLISWLVSLL